MSTSDPAAVPPAAAPAAPPTTAAPAPDDRRADPPAPAAAQLDEREPATTEAQREAAETIRSISRLEESN